MLYALRRPWADGSTPLLLEPLELLARLAALGPAPGTHWLRSHGGLAPPAAWRSAIGPAPAGPDSTAAASRPAADPPPPPRRRLAWAALLQRVFALEVLICPRCGGPRRILGALTEPNAVRRLLAALGLAAEPPPRPGAAVRPRL